MGNKQRILDRERTRRKNYEGFKKGIEIAKNENKNKFKFDNKIWSLGAF